MHKAHLFNYLGIESEDGTAFMENSREQVAEFGVDLHGETEITEVKTHEDHFHAIAEEDSYAGEYLILATGADRSLAEGLGCDFDDDIVDVDVTMETSVTDAYATGAMVRDQEWQAIISAGDGAAAALNVLSKEKGEHFHDFDTPADAE